MDGIKEVTDRLKPWAKANDIDLVWVKETLRLEHAKDQAATVVSFPVGFWEMFSQSTPEMRENALGSINLSVSLQYSNEPSLYAKDIKVPMSYLEEGV